MRERTFVKFGIGVALAVVAGFASVPAARADNVSGDPVTYTDPAVALVMPFDVRENHASFQLVNRIGGPDTGVIATHWSYWSDSCAHLADVFICLTNNDTVVVDPTALQGQVQTGQKNENTGAVVNLTGKRGIVTVTAFHAEESTVACSVATPPEDNVTDVPSLLGGWVIANTKTNAAFGNNAIGIVDPETNGLPDTSEIFSTVSGLQIPFFNPEDLTDSEIYIIGIAYPGGNGEFAAAEIGPIPALRSDGNAMCCNAAYFDNLENRISVDDVCFSCAEFSSLTETLATKSGNDKFLIAKNKEPISSGFFRANNCVVGSADDTAPTVNLKDGNEIVSNIPEVGDTSQVFPFAFHGMAVGPFGTSVSGKYTSPGFTE